MIAMLIVIGLSVALLVWVWRVNRQDLQELYKDLESVEDDQAPGNQPVPPTGPVR
ncbi:MAG: hypothetical protein HQL99_16865 [Magnetococcales bacterium]|nr:hypothetical protein [Magnetococcales bacterium]